MTVIGISLAEPALVIHDTDIGTDVDDCLALALILSSPELRLLAVTCVSGDVEVRARIARKLLRLRGLDRLPVFAGAGRSLLGIHQSAWQGHEGEGLLDATERVNAGGLDPEPGHAAEYLVRTVRENPGAISLIATGPLTNVAIAFLIEPRLPQMLRHLTIMGGVFRGPAELDLPYVEYNILSDPEAAHIVLSAGAPTTLVPLDITTKVRINRKGTDRLAATTDPFFSAVVDQIRRYPPFVRNGWTYLHDPLAVGSLMRPGFVNTVPAHVDVEISGSCTSGATLARRSTKQEASIIQVATEVDAAAFEEFFIDRLCGASNKEGP